MDFFNAQQSKTAFALIGNISAKLAFAYSRKSRAVLEQHMVQRSMFSTIHVYSSCVIRLIYRE